MDSDVECLELLAAMPTEQKISAYLRYAHWLTITARDFYGGVNPARLERCNESLHRLLGHLLKLQTRAVDPATARSFDQMVVDVARAYGWTALLRNSLGLTD